MNQAALPVAAEALFGSAARRTSDRISDIDYLIVDSDYGRLASRRSWLKAHGFSVSDYSWHRLENLVATSALFAVHLKLEAKIVHDESHQLASLLKRVQPKRSYSQDFQSSLLLFSPLNGTAQSASEHAWASDVAAVAFRNSAILQLANEGEYIFGFEEILSALQKRGRITGSDTAMLRRLRAEKRSYRLGNFEAPVEAITESLVAIERALREPIRDLVYDTYRYVTQPSTDAYAFSRMVERKLLRVPFDVSATRTEARRRLLAFIKDPHAYLWHFVHRREEIERTIQFIAAQPEDWVCRDDLSSNSVLWGHHP